LEGVNDYAKVADGEDYSTAWPEMKSIGHCQVRDNMGKMAILPGFDRLLEA
jgi:hypothetical protein